MVRKDNSTTRSQPPPRPRRRAAVARAQAPKNVTSGTQPFRGSERLVTLRGNADGSPVIHSFAYNPGLESTFSVGHNMAGAFNKYCIKRAQLNTLNYVPATATTAQGTVYMFIEYDSSDQDPTTQDEFADNEHTVTTSVWHNATTALKPSMVNGREFIVRKGNSTNHPLFTDACRLHIAAFGYSTGTADIGHVYIKYDAVLMSRQPSIVALASPRNLLVATLSANVNASDTETIIPYNSLRYNTITGSSLLGNGGIRLPRGVYEIKYVFRCDFSARDARTYSEALVRVDGVKQDLASTVHWFDVTADHTMPYVHSGAVLELSQDANIAVIFTHDDNVTDSVIIGESTSCTIKLIADG